MPRATSTLSALAFAFPVLLWGALAAPAAEDEALLEVKLDSTLSMRDYYRDMGLALDEAATEARQDELQEECFQKGSRRFGRIPRPIKFVGLFYDPANDTGERYTICMAIRPHDEKMARHVCSLVGRPLQENRMAEMALVCGPRVPAP